MASRLSQSIILKEGFLYKKGGVIKSWSRRFFVLSPQSLCYFKTEDHQTLEPLGRIFLSDIVSISTDGPEKKKAFVFVLQTKKRAVLLQGANTEDRDKWINIIKKSLDNEKEAEKKDPFRRSLRQLTPGVKRVTLVKDPTKGIGCTIKNTAGHIFVNRILEDGPIAETGVLRPGDELLEIHGTSIPGLSVCEVVEIIRNAPREFLVTVRPVTSVHKALKQDFTRIKYSDIVFDKNSSRAMIVNGGDSNGQASNSCSSNEECEYAEIREVPKKSKIIECSKQKMLYEPQPTQLSFEDVGDYDDEDEGDIAPPLPPWTEDALILVDPPPMKFNIYKTNAHLPPGVSPKRTRPIFHTPPPTRKDDLLSSLPPKPPQKPLNQSPTHRAPPYVPPRLYKAHSQGDGLNVVEPSKPPPPPPRMRGSPKTNHKYSNNLYDDIENTKQQLHYIDLDFKSR